MTILEFKIAIHFFQPGKASKLSDYLIFFSIDPSCMKHSVDENQRDLVLADKIKSFESVLEKYGEICAIEFWSQSYYVMY